MDRNIHIIANPVMPCDPFYSFDAFVIKGINFAKLFSKFNPNISVYLYGFKDGQRKCFDQDKFTYVDLTQEFFSEAQQISNNFTDPRWMVLPREQEIMTIQNKLMDSFYLGLLDQISKYAKSGDLVFHICDNFRISTKLPELGLIEIEVGKSGGDYCAQSFVTTETSDFLSWLQNLESYKKNTKLSKAILPCFDTEHFVPSCRKIPKTCLYMARLTRYKGFDVYMRLSQYMSDYTFFVAGTGVFESPKVILDNQFGGSFRYDLRDYPNVVYLGILRDQDKLDALSSVSVLVQPTIYREPCGWNVIEAALCGTPSVVSKYGGFIDTVRSGISGFLSDPQSLYHLWMDVEEAAKLPSVECRKYAVEHFSEAKCYQSYCQFFEQVCQQVKTETENMRIKVEIPQIKTENPQAKTDDVQVTDEIPQIKTKNQQVKTKISQAKTKKIIIRKKKLEREC